MEEIFDLINDFSSFEKRFDNTSSDDAEIVFCEKSMLENEDNGAFWENGLNNFNNQAPTTLGGIGSIIGKIAVGTIKGIGYAADLSRQRQDPYYQTLYGNNQLPYGRNYQEPYPNIDSGDLKAGVVLGILEKIFLGSADQSAYENISFQDVLANLSDYEKINFAEILPDSIPDNMTNTPDYLSADDFTNGSDYIETCDHFHFQEYSNSCALATITDIANDFGINVSEEQLREIAIRNGIYNEYENTTDKGTNMFALEDLIRNVTKHETQAVHFNNITDLVDALNNGDKVLLAVDSLELSNTPAALLNRIQETLSGREICAAGHAVEFKGIVSDLDGQLYGAIDDPARGHNIMYPLDQLLDACADFENFAVIIKQ